MLSVMSQIVSGVCALWIVSKLFWWQKKRTTFNVRNLITQGEISDDGPCITCKFHGSKFKLTDGSCVNWSESVLGVSIPSPTSSWVGHPFLCLLTNDGTVKNLSFAVCSHTPLDWGRLRSFPAFHSHFLHRFMHLFRSARCISMGMQPTRPMLMQHFSDTEKPCVVYLRSHMNVCIQLPGTKFLGEIVGNVGGAKNSPATVYKANVDKVCTHYHACLSFYTRVFPCMLSDRPHLRCLCPEMQAFDECHLSLIITPHEPAGRRNQAISA